MNKQGICNNCKLQFNYDNKQQSGKWCSNKCQMDHQYKTFIDNWKKGKETGRSGKYEVSRHIRRYLHEKNNSSCSCCGWNKVNPTTGKTPLHIDHINGDFMDNTENNLRLICPNCHSLTENFGSLNRGKGRYKKTNTKHPKFKMIP